MAQVILQFTQAQSKSCSENENVFLAVCFNWLNMDSGVCLGGIRGFLSLTSQNLGVWQYIAFGIGSMKKKFQSSKSYKLCFKDCLGFWRLIPFSVNHFPVNHDGQNTKTYLVTLQGHGIKNNCIEKPLSHSLSLYLVAIKKEGSM